VEAIVVSARSIRGESIARRTGQLEAIQLVAGRRVQGESIGGGVEKVEAIAVVSSRGVPAESVAGRVVKEKAILESPDVTIRDGDFCSPSEINPHVIAIATYRVPGAVEGYAAGAYGETVS
jgi:hypothetical protein